MSLKSTAAAMAAATLCFGLGTAEHGQVATTDALVTGFVNAWNAHDMSLLEPLLSEDADWVTVNGLRVKGLSEIQSIIAEEHGSWARPTSMTADNLSVRLLGSDVAVIHFDWAITGAMDGDGKPAGPLHGVTLFVAAKDTGGWRVVSGQVTNTRRTP